MKFSLKSYFSLKFFKNFREKTSSPLILWYSMSVYIRSLTKILVAPVTVLFVKRINHK